MKEPAFSVYQEYKQRRLELQEVQTGLLRKLKDYARGNGSAEQIRSLTDSIKEVSGIRESLRTPVHPLGFASDDSLIAFFIHILFLGILFLLSDRRRDKLNLATTLLIALALYLLFGWTNWVRNFVFNNYSLLGDSQGRTVFASVHWDIDPAGFLLQETRIVSMFLLDAILWQLWITHWRYVTKETSDWSSKIINLDAFGERANSLNSEFNRWQCHSLLLIGAFLPWTWFFWRKFAVQGDVRYISATIVMHIIWAISWLLLSLPVIELWGRWSDYRLKALGSVFGKERDDPDAERTVQLFIEAAPVNSLKIFGTGAATVASMLLPMAHTLFRG
jgi:hypothetical protein